VDARGAIGRRGEDLAAAYLEGRGYVVLARNWRCRGGELDLVVSNGTTVVFVEVRSRRGSCCGTPLESVDARKRERLARLALRFLATWPCREPLARFDVIGVRLDRDPPQLDHVERAFDVQSP
jgi:putative endonuclease